MSVELLKLYSQCTSHQEVSRTIRPGGYRLHQGSTGRAAQSNIGTSPHIGGATEVSAWRQAGSHRGISLEAGREPAAASGSQAVEHSESAQRIVAQKDVSDFKGTEGPQIM